MASATHSASYATDQIVDAQQAEYVAFLFRTPFATMDVPTQNYPSDTDSVAGGQ